MQGENKVKAGKRKVAENERISRRFPNMEGGKRSKQLKLFETERRPDQQNQDRYGKGWK